MRKTNYSDLSALFCNRINEKQSTPKPYPDNSRLLYFFNELTHHAFSHLRYAASKCLSLGKLKVPAAVVWPWMRNTGRLFVPWSLQCVKGDNGIFNGYEESLTLACMELFEMHEGRYSV